MSREKLEEQQAKEVSGGTGEGEPTMKWCEKCQAITEHDENGDCIPCNLADPGARYRF